MPCDERAEVLALRPGSGMVGDDLHPRPGHGVVVLLRSPRVRGDVLDPVADPGDRLGHAVSPHGHEGQVDVLPVPEIPVRAGDLTVRHLQRVGRGALEVHGLTAEQVGEAAAGAGIALHELSPQQASLEEAFMNLTRDELEFAVELEEAVA